MMRTTTLLFTIFVSFLALHGNAQTKPEQTKYDYAKALLQEGKYAPAAEVLERLALLDQNNTFYLTAYYMRALARYKEGQKQVAREQLFRLISEQPNWEGIADAHFLMANMQFEAGQAAEAMKSLSFIKEPNFQTEIYHLKKKYMVGYAVPKLKLLYASFPTDEAVGRVLLGKLYEEEHWEQELALIHDLEELYNTRPLVAATVPKVKDRFKVAFLLPFQEDKLDPHNPASNFVIDTYEGLILALDELAAQGIVVDHFDYDTKRDSVTTLRILQNEDLQKMDLIVGPLYSNTIPLVKEFCERYKIPMLNPISDNSDLAEMSKYAFLSGPSEKTQAKETASYVFKTLKNVTAYVIYGNGPKDEQMGLAFQQEFERLGGKVKGNIAFGYSERTYANLQRALSDLPRDGNVTIFMAASDLTAANTTISAVQNLIGNSTSATILAPYKWLEYNQLSLNKLETMQVQFYCQLFIDEHSESTLAWDAHYMEVTKSLPSRFSYAGYKAMFNAGQVLYTTKGMWVDKIHQMGPYKGAWQKTFYYTGNDNTGVSIVRFELGKLVQLHYSPQR